MRDLIAHPCSPQILAALLSLRLLSPLIFSSLPPQLPTTASQSTLSLPLSLSNTHTFSVHPSLIYSARPEALIIIYLKLWSFLKRQKQKKRKRRGAILRAWDTKTPGPFAPPALRRSFVSPFSHIPPSTVCVTAVGLPLSPVGFPVPPLPGSSIILCRRRWRRCRVIISYLLEYASSRAGAAGFFFFNTCFTVRGLRLALKASGGNYKPTRDV